jgi:multiple sugar transport system substrate-binding protein
MKIKKLLAMTLSVLLMTGMFAGCGKKEETSAVPQNQQQQQAEGKKDENVVITLGCWGSSPAETKLLDDQIQAFQNANPNITIKKMVMSGDYLQAIQAKIASKTEPDVYYLDVALASNFISKGVLEPLDSYIDQEDLKDFQPNLLQGFQADGKTYGLPKDYNTLALFYNKEMFEKAGVKVPTTWAELEEAAKKLTQGKVKGLSLPNDAQRFNAFILQAGGKINDGDKPAFNTSEAAKGLDFYYSLLKKGYAATPKDLGDGWSGDSLAHGNAAMVIEGGWMIPFMNEAAPNVKYGIAKLPKGDQEAGLAFTVAYVMSKNSKNKEAAAKVIKFLTGKEAQKMVADSGLAIPSRISMANEYAKNFPERVPLVEMTSVSKVANYGLNGSKILDALGKAGEKLQLGQVKDAKTALEEAANSIK